MPHQKFCEDSTVVHSRIFHFAMQCRTSACQPVIPTNHNYQFMKITGCKDTRNTVLSEESFLILYWSTILLISWVARCLFKWIHSSNSYTLLDKCSQYLQKFSWNLSLHKRSIESTMQAIGIQKSMHCYQETTVWMCVANAYFALVMLLSSQAFVFFLVY